MRLNLQRPLFFFDLETTGTNVLSDRIVELSYIKVAGNGKKEAKSMRLNPEMHIPEEASAVHGIYDADVASCPKFKDIAKELAEVVEDCDLAGFNSNRFDIPMLTEEFLRAGVSINLHNRRMIDVQNIYHKLEPRTLSAAYKFYCGKDLEDAHSACGDTRATYEVLLAQLDRYEGTLKNDVAFLDDFSRMNNNVDFAGRFVYNEKKEIVFNFGKHKGEKVTDVLNKEKGYYGWMQQADFARDTKQMLEKIKQGVIK